MGEFEKKLTSDDIAEIMSDMSEEIKSLIKSYSPNTSVRMNVISEKLLKIIKKYT